VRAARRVVLTGIARRRIGARPTEVDVAARSKPLRERKPEPVARALVLELQRGGIEARHVLVDRVERGPFCEPELTADLPGLLVDDVGRIVDGKVAGAVDVLVQL